MKAPPIQTVRYRGRNELSAFVFTFEGRSLPAQAPCRTGSLDADARGEAEPGAAAAERGILRPARDTRRPPDRRSLARERDRLWQPRRPRNLYRRADRRLEEGRRCRACQG